MWRALMIFFAAVFVALLAAWDAHVSARKAAAANFDSISDKIVISIGEKMEAYEQVLRGGVSLFDAFGPISRKQWSAYVRGLKLAENYPGVQGVGYAVVINDDKVDDLERSVHAEGVPSFKVYPRGKRELNTAILYLEPLDWRNQRALGFDMYSEEVRRVAMERARTTGRPALSGGVTLRQETENDVQRGVLLYIPVFEPSSDATAPGGTGRKLKGVVYSAFRMRDLMSRVLERTDSYSPNLVRVEIFDGPNASAEAVAAGLVLGGLAATLFGLISMGREAAHLVADRLALEVETRKVAEERVRVALRELAHRVKNTLTIVTAIATQTVRHSESLDEFDQKFRARLLGLSRVHDLLTSGRSYSTDLAVLAQDVLAPYQGDYDGALSIDGPPVVLTPNTAIMLSMLFNELATNATKYGAWSNKMGRVALAWQIEGAADEKEILNISWRERDGPPVSTPSRQGFGSNVIKFSVERSLRGKAEADFAPEGVTYRITIPWSEIAPETDVSKGA